MQIFFSHINPYNAANMIPDNRCARLLQETGQILAKGLGMAPFFRAEHPDQGDDLADGIRCNSLYTSWVIVYGDCLWKRLSDTDKAPNFRDVWTLLRHELAGLGHYEPSMHELIPVRLPKAFRAEFQLYNGLRRPKDAVEIYRKLLHWKYPGKIRV